MKPYALRHEYDLLTEHDTFVGALLECERRSDAGWRYLWISGPNADYDTDGLSEQEEALWGAYDAGCPRARRAVRLLARWAGLTAQIARAS